MYKYIYNIYNSRTISSLSVNIEDEHQHGELVEEEMEDAVLVEASEGQIHQDDECIEPDDGDSDDADPHLDNDASTSRYNDLSLFVCYSVITAMV